ncbi:MAG: YggS family pyridoxal phosphate-dependent enzyme [Gammaproteobacteria bacterium]|nr:MAG: YggS family pyridoxal phosphate-dependent enzyme [Gammaproteobacteria bacterium]
MTKNNLNRVNQRIRSACEQARRPQESVTLLAVSKRHSIASMQIVYQAGQRHFGENYLSEALKKQALLTDYAIIWHYIGSLQSNKTRKIAQHFSWVHSIDSLKIATRLSRQRPADLPPLNICLQINIDEEGSKSGLLPDYQALLDVARAVNTLPNIVLRGLMCIPSPKQRKEEEIATFSRMQKLMQQLNQDGLKLDTLSMGMSDDLDTAIACGATIVRVGTAIFGQRN